jgi:hypothetical protein
MRSRRGRTRLHRAERGTNIIELLYFFAMFIGAFLGAHYARQVMGTRWGWPLGGIIGFLLPVIALGALKLLLDFAVGGVPRFPNCREGTCRGLEAYKLEKRGDEFHMVCRHGGRYNRRGRRFVMVNDDGIETPYLIWRPFRGWCSDG